MEYLEFTNFKRAFLAVLTETMEGPQEYVAYLNRGSGFFPSLDNLDHLSASKQLTGQTTIAAHIKHSCIHLTAIISLIRGKPERVDWPSTWLGATVTQQEWQTSLENMKSAYQELVSVFDEGINWGHKEVAAAMAALAHLAYHLGAIRQILVRMKQV